MRKTLLPVALALAATGLHAEPAGADASEAPAPMASAPVAFQSPFAPPPLLAPGTRETGFPFDAEAKPEMLPEFEAVVEQSRRVDVSVTPQSAILYHGLMLTQEGEWAKAIPYLEEAIRRDPSMQAAWEGLGWCYIRTDDLPHAGRLWRYFRTLMPQESSPWRLLAQYEILNQNWEAADANYRKFLSIEPDHFEVRYWFAQNLMRIGKAEEAEAIFRALIEEEPERLDVQIDLASLLSTRFGDDEAVEILRRVNEELPGNPKFMLQQAALELRVGELRTADQLCLDVIEIQPTNTLAVQLRADIAEISGQQDIEPLQDVIRETQDPITRAALRVRLSNRCHLANQRKPGQYSTRFILGLLRDAIDEDPANVEYKVLYAERLLGANRIEECRSWVRDVLENHNRHHTRAKMVLFELAIRARRWDDAEQILADRYGPYDSTDPMRHYYEARLKTAQGLYQEALHEIDQMEAAAQKGTVLTLRYTHLTESDWQPATSVRRLHEHLRALQQEGWIIISPTEIPDLLGLKKGESRSDVEYDPDADVPLTARFVDNIRWAITGERRFKSRRKGETDFEAAKKYVCVTFDDALRSSLVLGTQVAQDFDVPFAIFTPTEPAREYVAERAGWEELREYADTGSWIVGSQLHGSYLKYPVDLEGLDMRPPLANRLWLPEKRRRESMNEWDLRMRTEFRKSRAELRSEMGEDDSAVPLVAYPYGNIGQEDSSNLSVLRSPMKSILAEASRSYQLGFIQTESGYTIFGDDLMLCRRYEPGWTAEGDDVVRHAYEFHPTFIARRLRCELAMLMGRPNLANEMLDTLRRDGYPEDLCRRMDIQIKAYFRNRPDREPRPLLESFFAEDDQTTNEVTTVAQSRGWRPEFDLEGVDSVYDLPEGEEPPEAGEVSKIVDRDSRHRLTETTADPLVYLSHPRVTAKVGHAKANDQIETTSLGLIGGIDLNRNTTLDVSLNYAHLKQTVRPYWNAIVVTNVPYSQSKYKFKSTKTDIAATLAHRMESGAVLYGTLGMSHKTGTKDDFDWSDINLQDELNSRNFTRSNSDTTLLVALGAIWHPSDQMTLRVLYDRDYVSSAVRNIVYNSIRLGVDWKPRDTWNLSGSTRYWSYDDDNAMFSGIFEAFWEWDPDLGVWLGLSASTYTTSDPCDWYWTPYWDQRIMGVIRYTQQWAGYNFRLDFLGGFHREDGRPNRAYENDVTVEKTVTVDGVANTVTENTTGWYVLEDQGTGWELCWGVQGYYEQRLNEYFTLILEGNITALREYIDHSLVAWLRASF